MKKIISFLFLFITLVCCGTLTARADELTVASGTNTNSNVPYIGNQADRWQHIQVIYPKAELAAMKGTSITKLTFYISSPASKAWGAEVAIGMAEVTESDFSGGNAYNEATLTPVYAGVINGNASTLEITLDASFDYSGNNNLLLDIQTTKVGSWAAASFTGKNFSYGCIYGYNSSSVASISNQTRASFVPKTLFTYEEAGSATCAKPANLIQKEVAAKSATFAWDKVAEANWQYICLPAAAEVDWSDAAVKNTTDTFAVIDGLTAETAYKFHVRRYCSADDQSKEASFGFTTEKSCYEPKNLAISGITATGATISWAASGHGEGKYQYTYEVWDDETPDWSSAVLTGETSATLSDLTPATAYQVWVRSYCGSEDASAAVSEYFATACAAMAIPYNQDFNSTDVNDLPNCWSAAGYDGAVSVASSGYISFTSKGLYFTGGGNAYAYAILPDMNADLNTLQVAFKHIEENSTKSGKIELGYYKDETFTSLKAYDITTSWKAEDAFPLSGVPAGAKLAFGYKAATNLYSAGIDDVVISVKPACPAPTALAANDVTAKTATLSWTSDAENFKVQYTTDKENWGEEHEVNAKTLALNELKANTKYYARVKAVCSSTESSDYSAEIEFTTECEAETLPFEEGFESALSACWSAASQWVLYTYSGHSGNQSIRYTSSSTADLTLPAITLDDAAQLTFWRQSNYVSCTVYANSATEENKLAEFAKSTDWAESVVDLSAYKNQTVTLIIRGNYVSGSRYLYIDDVKVGYAPVAAPTEFAAVAGNASATISWAAAENITWNLQYRAQGDENWKEVNGLTTNTYALEGIVNGVTYDVKVQAVASANRKSEWAATTVTPVDCPTVTEVTFGAKTYNSVVVNWTATASSTWALRYSTDGGENWLEASTAIANQTYTLSGLMTNTAYKIAVKPTCGSDEAWVIATEAFIPAYTEPVAGAATAITDAAATVTWTGAADATVYEYDFVIPGKAANWKETTELTATATDLKAATEYLFVVRTKYATGASQADTTAFATIAIAPKELAVSAVSANSATLIWANDGYADKYEWAVGNDANALLWNEVAAATKTLDELSANTAYTFYVRSKYSEDVKSDSIKLTFRTECAAASALAWTGGTFEEETAGEAPRCWTIYSPNAYPQISTWYPKSGTYHLYFDGGGKANSEQIAALPAFSEDIKTLKMSFYYYNHSYTGSYYPSLEVGVMSDLNDSASFRTLVVLDKLGKYASEATEVLFNSAKAEEKYIAFRLAGGTYNGRAIIDNITFSAAPTCFAPELGETTILPDGATFTWTAGSGEEHFQYALDTTETLVWTATDATSATIHGLTPGNSYKFYVRAACGETEKSDSVFTAFIPVCNAPSEPAVSAITTTGTTLSWTAAAGIAEYQYVVMAKGQAADWSKATKVSTNSVELTALAANTGYTAYVRSYYNETIQSAAASINFRTECAAITALPWSENFESQDLDAAPACWDLLNAQAANKSSYPYIAVKSESGYYQDAQALFFRSNGTKGYAILPALPLTNAQISFWHKEENGGSALVLGYLTNAADAESFVALLTCDLSTTGKSESAISLAAVPAGARLAFEFAGKSYYYDAAVDNILVEEIPACAVPTGLAASEISDTSAKLAWTSEATAFALQYKAEGDANWTDATGAISNPYVLEGLLANTKYYVQVKAVCDGEHQSEFCEAINFTTECATLTELNETFADGKPECWKGLESSNWTIEDGALKYKSASSGYFTTQAVKVTMENAVLSFNIKNDYYNYGTQYRSGMVTITADDVAPYETNFINSDNLENVQMIDLSEYYGKTITITFQVNNATKSSYYVYLDNVKIGVKPCDTPKNLSAVASLDSVVLAWEQGGDETTYQYCVVEAGAEASGWATLEAGVRTVTVKGLTTDQSYDAYVRSFCGAGREGETALKATFIPVCPQPSALEVTAVGAHSATLSWTAAAGITKYQYTLVENEWLEANIVEATSVNLNDLDAAKTYTFYVRAYHNATSVSAAISKAFTTDCDVLAMPFVENFNGLSTGLPTCWENKETNGWKYNNNGHDGACVRFDSYTTENGFKDTLSTPQITISGKEPVLTFFYKNRDGGAYTVAIDNGVDTTALISEGLTGVEQWADTTVSLSAYIGKTVRILFLATSNSASYTADVDAYLYLDDVQIIEKPEDPTAIENIFGNGKKAIKRVENGQLVIEYNGVIYNAQGTLIR